MNLISGKEGGDSWCVLISSWKIRGGGGLKEERWEILRGRNTDIKISGLIEEDLYICSSKDKYGSSDAYMLEEK